MNPRQHRTGYFFLVHFSLLGLLLLTIVSCKRETEEFQTEPLSDYLPLVPGKYITYRLDSTVYVNFGTATEVHKYQVKHVVDALVTDNLSRPSYRIFRYINDSIASSSWTPNGSYWITPLNDRIEVIEDNLRFVRLHSPVKEGYSWKGNKFLPDHPYGSLYSFSADNDMDDWEYGYGDISDDMIGATLVHDVRPVLYDIQSPSLNVQDNHPIVDIEYAYNTFALDKYAKNIGLVYREYILWEHQNNPTGPTTYAPFTNGFSIKMWMIDHN